MGSVDATFYTWRKKVRGLGVSELRRLRELDAENKHLKQLVADLTLDKHMLQEVIQKKLLKPADRRALVAFLMRLFSSANVMAVGYCSALGQPQRYQCLSSG